MMDILWEKFLYRWFPQEACGSILDLIQYCTERRWNAKFWRIVEHIRFDILDK